MQKRISEHTNTRKPQNAFTAIPLIIFTIVSSAPHNALAFELGLPTSPGQKLVADVRIARGDSHRNSRTDSSARTQAIVATASPITETANWPQSTRLTQAVQARPVPVADNPVILEGEASYYSRAGCLGCDPLMIMANGQPLDDNALTMAIGADKKHLVGHRARVTSLVTGKSVTVTITDTGGFYQAKYGHRVADLTVATKNAIGMAGGVGQVRVEVF